MRQGLRIFRDRNGIPHVEAMNRDDLYWGQGYVHGRDRGLQMILMRILGQGRASELLNANDEMLAIDIFFRRMNWSGNMEDQLAALPLDTSGYLQNYGEGVTAALKEKCPWELRILKIRPEPWEMRDSIMMSRMLGYLTLSQSQGEMERLFVQMVQGGLGEGKLEALFPGLLGGLDMDLLKRVSLGERVVPPEVLWGMGLPRMMASNNWVVSGSKTASGKPILSNDPHLEVNRLPNIWCEMVLRVNDHYTLGGSMPGFPGILTGRTSHVAWGVTYAFMDAIDSWVERCRGGQYYRADGDQWLPFVTRQETLYRKNRSPVTLTFYENDHGLLDGDPHQEGYYLATRWAPDRSGALSLDCVLRMWEVETVRHAMDTLGRAETAWSFVFADKRGDIGFQMSGLMPRRREGVTGFVPLPGWDKANDWKGFVSYQDLPWCINPQKGYFATANNDLNAFGRVAPINMPMGPYRAERIQELLEQGNALTPEDMFSMQGDLFSPQAKAYMEILRPLLPDTEPGRILRDWNLCYTEDSKGAFLFERFYKALYREVFGKNGMGEAVCDYLEKETGIFVDFYLNFDRVLLSEQSPWFGEETRDALYRRVAREALDISVETWGQGRKITLSHILFGGKLPSFLGFDRGPITGKGSRATIHQGQIYRSGGRTTTFFPSYRIVSDLSKDESYTNLAGGPSDRRFSKWYVSDLQNWLEGKYKTLNPYESEKAFPFP